MNKKSAILLFSVLFLLSLGALYVWGGTIAAELAGTTLSTEFAPGDGYAVSNWSKSDENVTLNMTIVLPSFTGAADGEINISEIWFETPAHVVLDDFANASNNSGVIYDSNGIISTGWGCSSNTDATALTYRNWTCANGSESQLGEDDTFTFMFNYSGNLSGDEAEIVWTVGIDAGQNASVFKTVSTNQDNQYPRLIEVNISDGNTTYANASWDDGGYFLNGPLYIEALIEDSQLENKVVLYYNCNSTEPTSTPGDSSEVLDVTNQGVGTIDQQGNASSSRINCDTVNVGGYARANETFHFYFLVNDTLNHWVQLGNGTGASSANSFNITLDDGELLPVINYVNVTQTAVSLTEPSGSSITRTLAQGTGLDDATNGRDYLAANTVTFDIELTGGQKPTEVWVVYNETGAATTHFGPAVIGGYAAYFGATSYNLIDDTTALNASCVSPLTLDNSSDAYENRTIYSVALNLGGNASNQFVFYVYANNTGNNYTRIGGPYRFTLDGSAPGLTMTPPTDLVITPRASITYSCTQTDAASGTNKMRWELIQPSPGTTLQKGDFTGLSTSGEQSITFTGDDTKYAGTYTVKCIGVDQVGNEATYPSTSTEDFEVHYSTYGEGAAEGGAVADIDLSTSEEITINEKQGTISTFTLDGTTIHTIKIKAVDEVAGTVTIVIESDPITITLKIGEMKEVDVDADGANDISVTLNGITDGVADLTTKRLTPLPTEKPTEEVPPTEKPAEEIPTAAEAASKTWLWILIIVIIVVIGVGYWFMKRK